MNETQDDSEPQNQTAEAYDFYKDVALEFLTSHCEVGERFSVSLDDLHKLYMRSLRAKGLTTANRNWFGRYVAYYVNSEVQKAGYQWSFRRPQRNGKTFYVGLRVTRGGRPIE